jgi:hypothetical protein
VLSDERIVVEVWIRTINLVNLLILTLRETFRFIQTPNSLQKALTPKHLVYARDTTGELIRRIENGGVAVGHLCTKRKQS